MKTHSNPRPAPSRPLSVFTLCLRTALAAQLLCLPVCTLAQGAVSKTTSAAIQPVAPVSGYRLVWNDEFEGDGLDASKWDHRTDSKHLSTQKPENVSVKGGLLRLKLKKEAAAGKQYTGAGIISKAAFKYGYYEARLKMPAGAGWHTSFWLMKHDGSGTTDFQLAEQGIVVVQNESVDHLSYAVKLEKYQEPAGSYGFLRLLGPDLTADFHVFGCEFTPDAVKFYRDGKLVQSVDASHMAHSEQNLWITSIASHMGNTPKVDDSALPQEAQCDYVRVFVKNDGTAPPK